MAAARKEATDNLRCHPVMAEFGRAKATLWLLDQILTGELSFLDQPGRRLPTWISTPLPGLDRAEVQGWLLDICAKVLVDCQATAEA